MENANVLASTSGRKRAAILVYVIALGFIDIAILSLTVLTFVKGMSDLVMEIFISIYYAIFYLITRTSHELYYGSSSVQFLLLSLLLISVTSASIFGAFRRKRWARKVNIFFLGIMFPVFVVIPTAVIWILPDAENVLPIGAVCILAVSLLLFDVYYFFWFLGNKQFFE